jgi:hypothetical protein
VVLTNRSTQKPWALRHVVGGGVAVVATALMLTSIHAAEVGGFSCVGGSGSVNCIGQSGPGGDPNVRTLPQPFSDDEREAARARDRKWVAQCQPIIDRDRYGVARYHYAMRGCEYGLGAD